MPKLRPLCALAALVAALAIAGCSIQQQPAAATPTISVSYAAPPDHAPATVVLSTSTPGATIYYTLDTTPPFPPPYNPTTLVYSSALILSQSAEVQALAYVAGMDHSDLADQWVLVEQP